MQLTPSTDQGVKLHMAKILAGPFVYSPQWSPCLEQTAIFLNMETVAQRGAIKQGGPFVYSPQLLLLYSGPLCSVVFLSKSQHALIHRLFCMCFMQDSSSELVAINHLFSVAKSKQRATIQ